MIRFTVILLFLLTCGTWTIRADTLVVTGVLLKPDKTRAAAYKVKIYAVKPGVADTSDPTSSYGVYTIVKENVDSGTISSWHLVCEQNNEKAVSKLTFEKKPNNIWQAKVDDLLLVPTDKSGYSSNEAAETIYVVTAIQAVKVKAGEVSTAQANETASAEAARILGRTEMGQDPDSTLRGIRNAVKSKTERSLPDLPLLQEANFMHLRERPEFQDQIQRTLRDLEQSLNPKPLDVWSKLLPEPEPMQINSCLICIRVERGVTREKCGIFKGTLDEIKAVAVKEICGSDAACVQASAVRSNIRGECQKP